MNKIIPASFDGYYKRIFLEREMFETVHVNLVWEDLLDTLGVDPVRINTDDVKYPNVIELVINEVRSIDNDE